MITGAGSLTDAKITPTEIDFPVAPETTIGDFMELEERLCSMFTPVKFDLEYHWENVDGDEEG